VTLLVKRGKRSQGKKESSCDSDEKGISTLGQERGTSRVLTPGSEGAGKVGKNPWTHRGRSLSKKHYGKEKGINQLELSGRERAFEPVRLSQKMYSPARGTADKRSRIKRQSDR